MRALLLATWLLAACLPAEIIDVTDLEADITVAIITTPEGPLISPVFEGSAPASLGRHRDQPLFIGSYRHDQVTLHELAIDADRLPDGEVVDETCGLDALLSEEAVQLRLQEHLAFHRHDGDGFVPVESEEVGNIATSKAIALPWKAPVPTAQLSAIGPRVGLFDEEDLAEIRRMAPDPNLFEDVHLTELRRAVSLDDERALFMTPRFVVVQELSPPMRFKAHSVAARDNRDMHPVGDDMVALSVLCNPNPCAALIEVELDGLDIVQTTTTATLTREIRDFARLPDGRYLIVGDNFQHVVPNGPRHELPNLELRRVFVIGDRVIAIGDHGTIFIADTHEDPVVGRFTAQDFTQLDAAAILSEEPLTILISDDEDDPGVVRQWIVQEREGAWEATRFDPLIYGAGIECVDEDPCSDRVVDNVQRALVAPDGRILTLMEGCRAVFLSDPISQQTESVLAEDLPYGHLRLDDVFRDVTPVGDRWIVVGDRGVALFLDRL